MESVSSFFDTLPNEVLPLIFSFLNRKEVDIVELVCSRFREVVNDPKDINGLRVKRYFSFIAETSGVTFEEKCVLAVKLMQCIENLLAKGVKRISDRLFKVNEDVYLYISGDKGEIQILTNFCMNLENYMKLIRSGPEIGATSKLINAVPGPVIGEPSSQLVLFVQKNNGSLFMSTVEVDLNRGKYPLKKRKIIPPERMKELILNEHFLPIHGYEKMRNYSNPSQEIFIKICGLKEKRAFVVLKKEDETKLFRSTNLHFLSDYDRITDLIELSDNKVVFHLYSENFESILEIYKTIDSRFDRSKLISNCRRLNHKKELVLSLPRVQEKSGFVIGGDKNSPKLILSLNELAGIAIQDLEISLRKFYDFSLGTNESLLAIMAHDQEVVNAFGLSHQEIILPLMKMVREVRLLDKNKFENDGIQFSFAKYWCGDAARSSPFDKETKSGPYYVIKNSNNQELSISNWIIDAIQKFGFYGGYYGGMSGCRKVSPQMLISFFNIDNRKISIPYKYVTKHGVSITDETGKISVVYDETKIDINGLFLFTIPDLSEVKGGIEVKWASDSNIQMRLINSKGENKSFFYDLSGRNIK